MYIPNVIRQIPVYIDSIRLSSIHTKNRLSQSISDAWQSTRNKFIATNFWQQQGKPFYERRIEPISLTDCLWIGGGLCLAALVTMLAVQILGFAFFPVALVFLAAPILIGVGNIVHHNVEQPFNKKAWEHIEAMRQIAQAMSIEKPNFAGIEEEYGKLGLYQFNHLKDIRNEIKEKFDKFQITFVDSKQNEKTKKDSQEAFIKCLVNKQKILDPSRPIQEFSNKKGGIEYRAHDLNQ